MATKTANVLARVEPQVKEEAENILATLGIPTSVLINMLYKQIILTKSVPFSLSVPSTPVARDEMSKEYFDRIMEQGILEANAGLGKEASEVFAELKNGV